MLIVGISNKRFTYRHWVFKIVNYKHFWIICNNYNEMVIIYYFEHQMSVSKRYVWYSNSKLHFLVLFREHWMLDIYAFIFFLLEVISVIILLRLCWYVSAMTFSITTHHSNTWHNNIHHNGSHHNSTPYQHSA